VVVQLRQIAEGAGKGSASRAALFPSWGRT
jgi:hypothetical protein